MKKIKLKTILLAMGLSSIATVSLADLSTERAVFNNDGTHQITARKTFKEPVTGDLYLATQINGQLIFFANEGQDLTPNIEAYRKNGEYTGTMLLLNRSSAGVPAGIYSLYQVVANEGTDPLNSNNWVGGASGLSSINFKIGLSTNQHGDFDDDGFSDDDHNRDSYHDDDLDKDGYHDDDDRDGKHDDDKNDDDRQNGIIPSSGGNVAKGKNTFAMTCSASGCHGSNPALNQNDILEGREYHETMEAIAENKGKMGFLKGVILDTHAKDVAAYLNSL